MAHELIGPREGSYRLRQLEPDNESQLLAVDFETTGLDLRNDRLRICSFLPFRHGGQTGEASVVDLWAGSPVDAAAFLSDVCRFVLVNHNGQFETNCLISNGHWPTKRFHCTQVLAQLVLAGERGEAYQVYRSPGLAKCVRYFLGQTLDKEEQTSEWSRPQLTQSQIDYAAADVEIIPPLFRRLVERIKAEGTAEVARIESEAVPCVGWMSSMGMPFDQGTWDSATRIATDRLNGHFGELRRHLTDDVLYGIDGAQTGLPFVNDDRAQAVLQSPAKLLKFFREIGVKIASTADDVLSTLEHPAAEALRQYRTYETTLKMFGGSWGTQFLADLKRNVPAAVRYGRVYPGWFQNSTEAGRFSAKRPNVQQIPNPKTHPMGKALRSAFRVGAGRQLVICDLSQIQLRIAAEISGDKTMCEAYSRGDDIHTLMARRILGTENPTEQDRSIAKACFSGDTEILTRKGWVRFDAYDGSEPLAQYVLPVGVEYNPARPRSNRWGQPTGKVCWDGSGGRIEFVSPLAFRFFEDRETYSIKDRNIDLVMTADHEVVYIDNNQRARRTPLYEVNAGNVRHVVAAGHLERGSTVSEVWTRILAMVVADGSFKGSSSIRLGFSKRHKIDRCRDLLRRGGVEFREGVYFSQDNPDVTTFQITEPSVREFLLGYVSVDKALSWDCLHTLNASVYLDEAAYWDSHVIPGKTRTRVLFSTTRKQTAEVMQAMAATSSIPSVLRCERSQIDNHADLWSLSYVLGCPPRWRASWASEPAGKQTVYCVQVPSGAILVRRDGRVAVMGNCNFGLLFGAGAKTFRGYARASYGIEMSEERAGEIRNAWLDTFPGIRQWHRSIGSKINDKAGITTRTLAGRTRKGLTFYSEALCSPIQGTEADIVKTALGLIYERRDRAPQPPALSYSQPGWFPVAVIHDEIVLEASEDGAQEMADWLRGIMIEAGNRYLKRVPCDAEAKFRKGWA